MPRGNKGKHTTCHHRIYRLTCDDFEGLIALADGRCQVCGIPESDTAQGYLYIDHDNRRGDGYDHVRGLVCSKCNSALRFVDNGFREPTAEQAEYLENAWFWTHHPSPSQPRTLAPIPLRRSPVKPKPQRMHGHQVRVADELWKPFCASLEAAGLDRSQALRDMMAWYVRRPGADLPPRPKRRHRLAVHDATAGSENDHTRP